MPSARRKPAAPKTQDTPTKGKPAKGTSSFWFSQNDKNDPWLECQDCGALARESATEPIIGGLGRFEMGDMFSDRECRKCGALCFPVKPRHAIVLEGGLPPQLPQPHTFGRLFDGWDDLRDAIEVHTPAQLAGTLRGIICSWTNCPGRHSR
jgi:hypothetical protein